MRRASAHGFEQKRIRSASMTDEARSAVEGGNAARLFHL
jgi:hypothetical protein